MKRTAAVLLPSLALLFAAPASHADTYDCFPTCTKTSAPPADRIVNLCEHKAVREIARIDRDLKPVKDVYEIATNPTGFALKMVSEHVVPIPRWVGYAMDPQGAARAAVMKRARKELKKQVGLQQDCAAELAGEAPDTGRE